MSTQWVEEAGTGVRVRACTAAVAALMTVTHIAAGNIISTSDALNRPFTSGCLANGSTAPNTSGVVDHGPPAKMEVLQNLLAELTQEKQTFRQ